MTDAIDVSNIDPGLLLACLYNRSSPQGMGRHVHIHGDMTQEEATKLLGEEERPYIDYLQGRVMKVEINGKTLDPGLYDRDMGEGAAQRAVDAALEITTARG